MLEQVMHPSVLGRGDYPSAIERWESVFPTEQILYLFHDDIRADADGQLKRVSDHLGLPVEPLIDRGQVRKEVNAAPPMSIPEAARATLEAHYRDQVLWLEQRFGRDLSHWLTR